MQNLGGGGVNKVHYGLCENGELIFPALYRALVI